jgi:hypothetical protein
MKNLAVILVALGLGFFVGYLYEGKQKDAQFKTASAEATDKVARMNAAVEAVLN